MQCATAVEPQWLAEMGPMFFSVKDSDTSMLDHKQKKKDVKSAMEEEKDNLRKEQVSMEKVNQEREKQKRAKQQQQILMPGCIKYSSTYLRPKKLGLYMFAIKLMTYFFCMTNTYTFHLCISIVIKPAVCKF
ncbi:hypothetical protein MKW94_004011 [Papaver nudicaule]|uniref:Uncharacterized protein n=1 Tax=Papaver nudicaule TaxID=74823 RepID=A0AA41RT96_PAPNU|nr:hypothetical protein [Papaver nudicaule]